MSDTQTTPARRVRDGNPNPITDFGNGLSLGDAAASMLTEPPAEDTLRGGGGDDGLMSLADDAPFKIQTGTSLQETADSMLVASDESAETSSADGESGNTDVTTDDGPIDVSDAEAKEADAGGDDEEQDGDDVFDIEANLFDSSADQGSGDDTTEEGPLDVSSLDPETVMTITVDGETQDVPLGDLIKSYNGAEVSEKRIQEATEYRDAASKVYENANLVVSQALKLFNDALFAPQTEAPNPDLAQSNPAEYQRLDALHKSELSLLHGRREQMQQALQAAQQQQQTDRAAQMQSAQQELFKLMPVLKHKTRGPQMAKAINDVALSVKYTQEEINACTDPRLFQLAAMAAATQRRLAAQKAKPQKPKTNSRRKAAPKASSTVNQRNDQATLMKAQKSGHVDDVANSLLIQS